MKEAGFNNYLAVEGAMEGDQLTADSKSYDYVTQILNELDISQNWSNTTLDYSQIKFITTKLKTRY